MEFLFRIAAQGGNAIIICCKQDAVDLIHAGVVLVPKPSAVGILEAIPAQLGIGNTELAVKVGFGQKSVVGASSVQGVPEHIKDLYGQLHGQHLRS